MLYLDTPLLERLERASASGFRYVEYQWPYEQDIQTWKTHLEKNGLEFVLYSLPPGNRRQGERGLASLPDRIDEFRRGVSTALQVSAGLGCTRVNCLVGKRDERFPLVAQQQVMVENLSYAAEELGQHGITLVVEMVNRWDLPGYLLTNPSQAFALQAQVGSPNLLVLYDVYHAQRTEGNLADTIQRNLARIGHIHIADNPGRHQPGTGEINYAYLLQAIDRLGYLGYVGLEYIPEGTIQESLNWVSEYGYSL